MWVKAGRCWPPLPPTPCRPTSPRPAPAPDGSRGQRRRRPLTPSAWACKPGRLERPADRAIHHCRSRPPRRVEAARPSSRRSSWVAAAPRCWRPTSGVISARTATVALWWWAWAPSCSGMVRARAAGMARRSHPESFMRIRPGRRSVASGAAVEGTVRMVAPPWTRKPATPGLQWICPPTPTSARACFVARRPARRGPGALTVPQEAVVVRDGFFIPVCAARHQAIAAVRYRMVACGRPGGDHRRPRRHRHRGAGAGF